MKEGLPMEDRYNVECCDFIHIHKDLVERCAGSCRGRTPCTT